jgi:hypothetical protein
MPEAGDRGTSEHSRYCGIGCSYNLHKESLCPPTAQCLLNVSFFIFHHLLNCISDICGALVPSYRDVYLFFFPGIAFSCFPAILCYLLKTHWRSHD